MFALDNWKYLLAALVLHAAIGVMLIVGIRSKPHVVIPSQLAIQGVIVDHSAERLKRERAEKERLAKQQAEAAEKTKQLEAERQENERQENERKEAERKATEKKLAEHQAQIAAQEKQRATERKQREAQETKRLAEIKDKQAEKQRNELAAREQAQRESELKRQLAEEEGRTQVRNSGLMNQYALLIAQRVERNWNKPPSAAAGIECNITVTQAPGGSVLSVQVGKCNGDAAVRQSIEAAVYRSSPLPPPPDARLFERVIVFVFKPSE